MKKWLAILLVLALAASLISGCGKSKRVFKNARQVYNRASAEISNENGARFEAELLRMCAKDLAGAKEE